jgi:hypothetical protein
MGVNVTCGLSGRGSEGLGMGVLLGIVKVLRLAYRHEQRSCDG